MIPKLDKCRHFNYLQAVIIAWTSDFVPRMVYLFGYSDNQTLTGFINNSLSLFNTANYSDDTRPMDPGDGFTNIGTCRFVGSMDYV